MLLWAHPGPHIKWHIIGSAIFSQLTTASLCFTMGCPFPLKFAPLHGGSGPHQIHGSFDLVHTPNGISIGSAIFAGLTASQLCQTDRQITLLQGCSLDLDVSVSRRSFQTSRSRLSPVEMWEGLDLISD